MNDVHTRIQDMPEVTRVQVLDRLESAALELDTARNMLALFGGSREYCADLTEYAAQTRMARNAIRNVFNA